MAREAIKSYPMGINTSFFSCVKRKFRFLFEIQGITDISDPLVALPAQKATRPSISLKEMDVPHLQETIYLPGRPDWKQLSVTLYDVNKNHPIWKWLLSFYNPGPSNREADILNGGFPNSPGYFGFAKPFKKDSILYVLDGCGNEMERWVYQNCWPTEIDYGDMDMSDTDILTINLTMRYDRAYNPNITVVSQL